MKNVPACAVLAACVLFSALSCSGGRSEGEDAQGGAPGASAGAGARAGAGASVGAGARAGEGESGAGASGGAGAGGFGEYSPRCAGQRGRCIEVCEGGSCSCHCDCRSTAECGAAHETRCVPPGEPSPPCCGAISTCEGCAGAGADPDRVCSAAACMSCVPRCTTDALCGDGYVCGDAGLCVAARCDLHGYVCPPRSQCSPAGTEADSHGCLHDACTQDAECNRGACVEGRCHATAGRCVFLTCA